MSDYLVRILSDDGLIRATAAVTTGLVEEIRRRQGTDPTATVAIGRLATGAALMSSLLKGRQRLALVVEGNGPLQRMQAEADADGRLRASVKVPATGGYLFQAMPGCSDAVLAGLEERLRQQPSVSKLLPHGMTPEELLAKIMAPIPYHNKQRTELVFGCSCRRNQVAAVLLSLGRDELQKAIAKEENLTVACDFCRQEQVFTPSDLRSLLLKRQ